MKILYGLVVNELKKKVVGSYAGWFWLFFKPMAIILTMWFVFSYGFKTPPVEGESFIVWIAAGLIVWFFFSECLPEMTNSIVDYSFLLRQVGFNVKVIPMVKLLSSSVNYFILLLVLLGIYFFSGGELRFSLFALIYYSLCLFCFSYSLGVLLSSLRVFVKDVSDFLISSLQVCFWVSPIIWNISLVPDDYVYLFKLNPLVYILEGVRGVLVKGDAFSQGGWGFYFWGVVIFVYLLGRFSFNRLKPYFNDVL